MKKIVGFCIVILFMATSGILAADKVKIVTTLTDLASLAEAIGGDKVEVYALAKGSQDPHKIEVLPSYMMKLRKADLFILVGMDLDLWAYQLRDGSRNSNLVVVDCSKEINRREVPTRNVNPSQGHLHIYGNPHYWLDPENGKVIMKAILRGLEKVAPEHYAYFLKNMNTYTNKLDIKISEWQKKIAPFKGRKIIFYHNSWPYFAERFGLEVVNFIEPKPGIPPSPSHTAKLIKQVKNENINVIALEPYFDDRVPKMIAKQTDATVVTLPQSVGGVKEANDYIGLFDYNLNTLIKAFQK